jgi:hypothetical protein
MKKEKGTIKEKRITLATLIIIAITIAILIFAKTTNNQEEVNANSQPSASGNTNANTNPGASTSSQVTYSSLSSEEIAKVSNAILSSEFVKSIPEKDPVSLTFFKFENGQRIWQNSFLIGKSQFLTTGTPGISLILHSKYISQLDGTNLCDIIKQANKDGDLGMETKYSTATLFFKYAGMLKYRNCFGI